MKTSTSEKKTATSRRTEAGAFRTVGDLRQEVEALAQRAHILDGIVLDLENRFCRREGEPVKLKVGGALVRVRSEVVGQLVAEIRAGSVAAWQRRLRLERTCVAKVESGELPRLFER